MDDFRALDPFFRIIEQGLAYADGGHFFDPLAEDVVFDSVAAIEHRKVTGWRDYLDPLRVFAALEGRD